MSISKRARTIKALSRLVPRRLIGTKFSLKESTLNIIEKAWELARRKKPLFRRGLTAEKHPVGNVLCEWLYKNPAQKNRVLLYLHGGAYLSGNLTGSRNRAMRYPLNTSASLFIADYRTSAAAPFPAALEDSMAAYRYLLGTAPEAEILIMGDSAGGGLALATVLKAREEGLPLPAKILLNSPWTDLTCATDTYINMKSKDVVLEENFLKKCARLYGGNDLRNPYISPVFGDFHGFPPVDIHVGTDEILLDDSRILAERLRRDGAEVSLREWEGMFHMFHYWEGFCPEGTAVCRELYRQIDS